MMTSQLPSAGIINIKEWRKLSAKHQVDPYAVWCLQTKFRSLRQPESDARIKSGNVNGFPSVLNFIVELRSPYEPGEPFEVQLYSSKAADTLTKAGSIKTHIDPTSRPPGSISDMPTPHITLDVPPTYVAKFDGIGPKFITLRMMCKNASEEEIDEVVRRLVSNEEVKRLQLGFPRGSKNPDHRPACTPPASDSKASLVLGVLEDNIPFAHGALREESSAGTKTRIQMIWDQSTLRLSQGNWHASHQFTYGQQLIKKDMDVMLQGQHDGIAVDEDAVYAASDYVSAGSSISKLGLRASHGAAVLSLLAGEWHAASGMPQHHDPDHDKVFNTRIVNDQAAATPIIAVQLPQEQVAVSSGRWLSVNALDGLHYIVEEARRMSPSVESPPSLVINVSYGAIAGPHDGSGMLECAIDELTQLYSRSGGDVAVVLAAGNNNGYLRDVEDERQYVSSGIHAKASIAVGSSKTFTLFIPPDKQFETYVEIWFDRIVGFDKKHKQIEIIVTPPNGQSWVGVSCRENLFWPNNSSAQAGLLFYPNVSQGNDRSMALLVVAATQIGSSQLVSAPSGQWKIQVKHLKSSQESKGFDVEAWVERDDATIGAHRPQSARFVNMEGDANAVGPSDTNTFASIATGGTVFTAGALLDRGANVAADLSPYSATGSEPDKGPLFSAVVDGGYALPGIRVSGSQSGMVVRANGTSMAAPQGARWLINSLGLAQELGQPITSAFLREVIRTLPAPSDSRHGRLAIEAAGQAVVVSRLPAAVAAFETRASKPPP